MSWNSNLRKGVDIPTWDWLSFLPGGNSNPGAAHAYDGSRHLYWLHQVGSATAASTTQLWQYDTWTDGWKYIGNTTSGFNGIDLKYDPVRNVLIMLTGNGGTEWRVFSLNTGNISMLGQTITPYTFTTITTVLPAAAGLGAGLALPKDAVQSNPALLGTALTGSTSTVINVTADQLFTQGHAGMRLRMTSGTYSGQYRTITSVNALGTQITLNSALGGAPANGDTFIVEVAQGTATGTQSTTTLQDTNQSWTTNFYANMDVEILSGTGAGQRRRIASNTATTLTLASAVTGNTATGPWSVTPDATSVYQIVPSRDFLFYQSGSNGTGFYRIDLNTGASSTTWTTLTAVPGAVQGGGDLVYTKSYAPYTIYSLRGNGTSNIYQYNIGLNTWTTLPTTFFGGETFNTGTSISSIDSAGRLLVNVQGQNRILAVRLSDCTLEPVGTLPYAAPAAYDGHRMCKVATDDGVQWLYFIRAGGAEHYRLALEWY